MEGAGADDVFDMLIARHLKLSIIMRCRLSPGLHAQVVNLRDVARPLGNAATVLAATARPRTATFNQSSTLKHMAEKMENVWTKMRLQSPFYFDVALNAKVIVTGGRVRGWHPRQSHIACDRSISCNSCKMGRRAR
jgi:hypothetical protein